MQTFLPYKDFKESAKVLDNKRLGKQRVEAYQIYKALTEENNGWRNHPAVLMWKGHEDCLLEYMFAMIEEWTSRGFKDTIAEKFEGIKINPLPPSWLGDPEFHAAHRSNLLRKSEHYKQFNWREPNNLPYIWRVKKTKY